MYKKKEIIELSFEWKSGNANSTSTNLYIELSLYEFLNIIYFFHNHEDIYNKLLQFVEDR